MHEPMIGQIHHFFLSKIELIPFIIANQQHKSMRTSRIDRCEPRYAGTEFTNRGLFANDTALFGWRSGLNTLTTEI